MSGRLQVDGLVSTIVPVHNRPAALGEAVFSVLAQSYRPIEVIIVDDGSTDGTLAVANALAAAHPDEIRVIRQDNAGPGCAREAGRRVAKGEFLQYLDSDDVLLAGKFAAQVSGLRAAPECGASYGYTRYRHPDGRSEPAPWKGSGIRRDSMFPSFLLSRWWDTPTPLYRASVCEAAGPWTELRLEEDWEYDCRIAALGVRLHHNPMFVAEVRDHGEHRLSRGEALDPSRLIHRARAHVLIYEHAVRAGIDTRAPEMQHFARELFLLARQCGAAGLVDESRTLFLTARVASGSIRAGGVDFRLYAIGAAMFGWSAAGRFSCMVDWVRDAPRLAARRTESDRNRPISG